MFKYQDFVQSIVGGNGGPEPASSEGVRVGLMGGAARALRAVYGVVLLHAAVLYGVSVWKSHPISAPRCTMRYAMWPDFVSPFLLLFLQTGESVGPTGAALTRSSGSVRTCTRTYVSRSLYV